jgi:hypothetical protein
MKSQISVPVPVSTFLALAEFLKTQGSDRDPIVTIDDAIHYWMDNAGWKQDDLMPEIRGSATRGYTWKYKNSSIFLVDSTDIRMRYKGQYHYAKVDGDEIKYEGKSVTPSTLANSVTGSSRNAWRDLWIKFLESKEWILADMCREQSKDSDVLLKELVDEFGGSKS